MKNNKYTLEIKNDDFYDSPREWDNIGTMYCQHRCYNLGDKFSIDNDECYSFADELKQIEVKQGEIAIAIPLFLYDHSGISMSYGDAITKDFESFVKPDCGWDSGMLGFIFITKEKVRKEYNVKRISKKLLNNVVKILESEVEAYNQYLTGDVYYYEVLDSDGCCVESCGGFYSEKEAIAEGKSMLACIEKQEREKKHSKLKAMIKANVGLDTRHSIFA